MNLKFHYVFFTKDPIDNKLILTYVKVCFQAITRSSVDLSIWCNTCIITTIGQTE